ncbi:hypothetical protein [Ornithinibacillus sp. FSL M8-0202]|uniref:hypothetical protein n=1 Tax=unclassified Ornithinibacillus TaxID=2620869 RepID=UPI0030D505F2
MLKKPFLMVIGIIIIFTLVGCNTENNTQRNSDQPIKVTQISAKNTYDQSISNKAKQILSKKENITRVLAANTDKILIIAIEIPHHERFGLQKVNKELSKEMDEEFKYIKVELVTDKKIVIELEKIEERLQNNDITKKELEKELKHISKLLKEQT